MVIILGILIGAVLIYGWIKLINAVFNPLIRKIEKKKERITKADNPYIKSHRIKMHNDKMYGEYLDWLDKTGGDMPFEKWKTEEEEAFDKKYQDASFTRWRPNK